MATVESELEDGVATTELATDPVAASATPRPPAPADASDAGKEGKKAKKSKKADKKKDPEGAGAGAEPGGPSVAAHPRAARGVARAKAWGGLAGFALAGYLSLPTHTVADAMARALLAGIICYVAFWAAAVFAWRRLVMLELRAREHQLSAPALPSGGAQAAAGSGTGGPAGAARERR